MSGPSPLDAELLRAHPLPRLGQHSDKEARGRVLVVGGSAEVPGGALLSGVAALRAGAGKLQIAVPASVAVGLAIAVPEARVFGLAETEGGEIARAAAERLEPPLASADAVLIGPGMLDEQGAGALAAALLEMAFDGVFLADAGAMTGLAAHEAALRRRGGRVVLTPHAGEMAALTGLERSAVEAAPAAVARDLAVRLHAVIALKGAETFIASPDGAVWHYVGGSVGLGTAGSGDVLAGLITGLAARGAPPLQAVQWGVFLHGEAGARLHRRIGPLGYLARELAAEVPPLLAELCP